jgi:GTP-binding protein HflX
MTTREAKARDAVLERAALVSLVTRSRQRGSDPDAVLDELAGLARAAGAEVVVSVVQDRPAPDAATLIGRGKAETLAKACEEMRASIVIVDNVITPAQARNLEKICGRRVIDRTELILDIFAQRARTHEGKLQVELAQLQYALPRLAGSSDALSRLGGGIGTRGPGETKLETDRRRIRHRIAALKREITEVRRRRGYLRARRRRSDVPTVALVGYTNAGKTTIFNWLTGSEATASNALFVTLDPLMRRMKLADARQIVVADTVGFIDRLPHQLVASFHATLEEVSGADLLVHVIDAAAPDRERRIEAVRSVLSEVGAAAVPAIEVFNKIDMVADAEIEGLKASKPSALFVSAGNRVGREALVAGIGSGLAMDAERMRLVFDGSREGDRRLVAELYRHARVVSHVADANRVSIEADVPKRLMSRFTRAKVPA